MGDEVLALAEWKDKGAEDGLDQRLSYEKVTDIFTSSKEQALVYLTLETGEVITATDGHPFKTAEGWRDAILLKKGGKLLLKGAGEETGPDQAEGGDNERRVMIADVRIEHKTVKAYNLEVANAHTFFVGEDGVAVHNGNGSYTCFFKSGKKYHGKGDRTRAKDSANRISKNHKDELDHIDWADSENTKNSFMDEARRIRDDGGVTNPNNYNKINSPGEKYLP
ncbi:hypothetical protein AGMMS49545_21960 [Betaproteobacteria bacterium]|nr:hypothetical protein AGMMS49545_21960 [Betaproteobacteria bacterium]